jgi:hypothetical protein
MTSWAMFKPAFVNQIAERSMQSLSSMELSQKDAIGPHKKMLPQTPQAPHAATIPRTIKHAFWKRRTGNIRRYCIRIETLVMVSARLYIQRPDQNA